MEQTKLFKALATAAFGAAILTAGSSAFAQSAVLKLTGTITPPSCTPTLTGGGTVDYGTVSAKNGATTVLPEKKTTLQINCTAPSLIGYKVTDNRANTDAGMQSNFLMNAFQAVFSIAGASGGIFGWHDQIFGLGQTASKKNIGGYSIKLAGNPTVDGSNWLKVNTYNATKEIPVIGGLLPDVWMFNVISPTYISKGAIYAAGGLGLQSVLGLSYPLSGKTFSFPLAINAMLDSSNNIGGSADGIKIDGQATFDLVYL